MRNAEQVANRHELTITNLTISKGDFRLLDNISVRFLSGRVAVILGATGCGKSTLIRAIAGLEQANAGRIGLDQLDMTAMPAYKRAGIATVLQRPGMFPKTTPRKNLQMVMESHKSRVRNEFNKVDQILELVNLTHLADAKVDSFSGGEIARVALARAIAVDPIFLMVDEALSAIDAPLRRRILRGIADHYIAQNKGLVFVTHDQLDAFMFADHLILIDDGKIVADGSPRQIYGTPPSRSVGEFLGLATILSGFVETFDGVSGKATAHLPDLGVYANVQLPASSAATPQQEVTLIIRPEDVIVHPIGVGTEDSEVEAYVLRSIFTGGTSYLLLKVEGSGLNLISRDPSDYPKNQFSVGDRVTFMLREGVTAVSC